MAIQSSKIGGFPAFKGFGNPLPQYDKYKRYATTLTGGTGGQWIEIFNIKIDNAIEYTDNAGKAQAQISDRDREVQYLGLGMDVTTGPYGGVKDFDNLSLTLNIDDKDNLSIGLDQHPIHRGDASASAVSPYEFRIYYKKIKERISDTTADQYDVHLFARTPGNRAPLWFYPTHFEATGWGSPFNPVGYDAYSSAERLEFLFRNTATNQIIDESTLTTQMAGYKFVSSRDSTQDQAIRLYQEDSVLQLKEQAKVIFVADRNDGKTMTVDTIVPDSHGTNGYTGFILTMLFLGGNGVLKSGGAFNYSVKDNHLFTGNQDVTMKNGRAYQFLRYGPAWFLINY